MQACGEPFGGAPKNKLIAFNDRWSERS